MLEPEESQIVAEMEDISRNIDRILDRIAHLESEKVTDASEQDET